MGGRERMGGNLYLLARYTSSLRSLASLAGGLPFIWFLNLRKFWWTIDLKFTFFTIRWDPDAADNRWWILRVFRWWRCSSSPWWLAGVDNIRWQPAASSRRPASMRRRKSGWRGSGKKFKYKSGSHVLAWIWKQCSSMNMAKTVLVWIWKKISIVILKKKFLRESEEKFIVWI